MKSARQQLKNLSREAFARLSSGDPLQKLPSGDKELLFSLLFTDRGVQRNAGKPDSDMGKQDESIRAVRNIGKLAQELLNEIESHVLKSPSQAAYKTSPVLWRTSAAILQRLAEFQDIPKRGVDNGLIMIASHFIKQKTDSFFDGSLSELIEVVTKMRISGEAIAKQRARLLDDEKKAYVDFAAQASSPNKR